MKYYETIDKLIKEDKMSFKEACEIIESVVADLIVPVVHKEIEKQLGNQHNNLFDNDTLNRMYVNPDNHWIGPTMFPAVTDPIPPTVTCSGTSYVNDINTSNTLSAQKIHECFENVSKQTVLNYNNMKTISDNVNKTTT